MLIQTPKGSRSLRLFIFSAISALTAYGTLLFLISLGDAIMSYSVPIFLEKNLGSSFWMGLVMAASSLVGVIADIVLGEWFGHKKYKFFLCWVFITALTFPLTLLIFPPVIPFFLLAMAVWGLYYELIQFANYHFIKVFVDKDQHAQSWGILSVFQSCAYLAGPLIAELLIDKNIKFSFAGTIGFLFAGFLGFMIFIEVFPKKSRNVEVLVERKKSLYHELSVWQILLKYIWPLWIFHFVLTLIDSTFWSVGILFSEELRNLSHYGGFLLTAYTLPALLVGFLAGKVAKPFGKKRAAFLAGLLEGVILLFVGFTPSIPLLLLLVFTSSAFASIAFPEVHATYEDYIKRLGVLGGELIGLNLSSTSFAYIIGPALSGGLAALIGNQKIFSILGGLLILVSLLALVVTPKKIHMPQQELAEVENN